MKRFLLSAMLLSVALLSTIEVNAQCVVEYFSLQKKVYKSDLIIEGKVISQTSYWDANKMNIYTLNRIKVFKSLNGVSVNQFIELVTDGGTVGLERHQANPSLELELGEEGVFMMVKNNIPFSEYIIKNGYSKYRPTASIQSFIKYDRLNNEAYGYHEEYKGIESLLLPKIEAFTGFAPIKINNTGFGKTVRPTAAPAITSFGLDTITAGTGSILVINGTNFNIIRGTGKVSFRDANYGDGRYYDVTLKTSYKSWTNTKIEVYVPSRAATGRVKVTNSTNEAGTSTSDVFIPYSHLNVTYGTSTIDTAFHQVDHINDNTKGGYTWQMTNNFASKTPAVNAFMRSLENWRCGTLMNWDVGSNTTTDATAKDNINIVRFTKFGDSKLGVCWSRWSGCSNMGNFYWFLNELDIEFDSSRNWYYGEGTTPNSMFDFESVSTHELGHGHQLGHVNDTKKIMHYSIGKGDRKTTLHSDDIDAGAYVRDKSKVKNACGPNPIVPIKASDCNITKPKAKFTSNRTNSCTGTHFILNDATEGIVTAYAWTFDEGASITSANTAGPFAVSYSTKGMKTIRLIATNDFGNDTFDMVVRVDSIPVKPDTLIAPEFGCVGESIYTIDALDGATEYVWSISAGGSVNGNATDSSIKVDWNAGGPYTISVKGKNDCGEGEVAEATTEIQEYPVANFDHTKNGLEVTFQNKSDNGIRYRWDFGDFGDKDTSTEKDPFYVYSTKGTFTATAWATNECASDSISKTVQVTYGAGISSITGNKILEVSPNPIKDDAIIKYNYDKVSEAELKIMDMNGKMVFNKSLQNNKAIRFEKGNLPGGTYIFELRSGTLLLESGRLLLLD